MNKIKRKKRKKETQILMIKVIDSEGEKIRQKEKIQKSQ